MRGDDLGALLAGDERRPRELRAFSSIDGARMFTDGARKLICSDDECRMFDLASDPGERRDVAERAARRRPRAARASSTSSSPRCRASRRWRCKAAARGRTRWRARGWAMPRPGLSSCRCSASARADVRAAAARARRRARRARCARRARADLRARDADHAVARRGRRGRAAAGRVGCARAGRRRCLRRRATSRAWRAAPRSRSRYSGDCRAGEAVLLATAAADAALDEPDRLAAVPRPGAAGENPDASLRCCRCSSDVRLRPRGRRPRSAGSVTARQRLRSSRAARQERYPSAPRRGPRAARARRARHGGGR